MFNSKDKIFVITGDELYKRDHSLLGIFKFMDVSYEVVHLNKLLDGSSGRFSAASSEKKCIAINALIFSLKLDGNELYNFIRSLVENENYIFVYNVNEELKNNILFQLLIGTQVVEVDEFIDSDNIYSVTNNIPEISKQLTGMEIDRVPNHFDLKFTFANTENFTSIIEIEENHVFTKIKNLKCEVFLNSSREILNLEEHIKSHPDVSSYFTNFIPVVMFIRYCFSEHCWHNPNRTACWIVDDPNLKNKYGYFKYKTLFEKLEHLDVSLNIAFIPYNFKKASNKTLSGFNQYHNRLSVSVHGNNHTRGEFGLVNEKLLNGNVQQAVERMDSFTGEKNLQYKKVFVFPQGIFSKQSLGVLKSNNFLAAINSGPCANNESKGISFKSYLDISIMDYSSFPLFLRRYPNKIYEFAIDLFLGKPLFIVEHHEYFKDNFEEFEKFTGMINQLDFDLSWVNIDDALEGAYKKKKITDEEYNLAVYSTCVKIRQEEGQRIKYNLIKAETIPASIKSLLIEKTNSNQYLCRDNFLYTSLINSKPEFQIKLEYNNIVGNSELDNSFSKRLNIFLRRKLSDLRDNYLIKNKIVFNLSKKIYGSVGSN